MIRQRYNPNETVCKHFNFVNDIKQLLIKLGASHVILLLFQQLRFIVEL